MALKDIFEVVSDYETVRIDDRNLLDKIADSGLGRSSKSIPIGLGYPALIIPYNSKHRVYRRRGYSAFAGSHMHEVILLDEKGNIDPSTPLMFEYNYIDYIDVYRTDIKPITISGGTFTTRACRTNMVWEENGRLTAHDGYINRGFNIRRSYTTVKDVKHYVTDELTVNDQIKDGKIVCCGYCYHGFFSASFSNEILFDGCILTGRRCYTRPFGGTGGTYDLGGNCVNKIIFNNCTQSNFWITMDENNIIHPAKEGDPGAMTSMCSYSEGDVSVKLHWGIGGTNFCKNMEYHNSTLSRFDAHCGLYNGKIINCTVNYMAITGNGDFIVENTRWFAEGKHYNSNSMLHLREDYGSTWEGMISMKNIKAYIFTTAPAYIYMHSYSNWYYGYIANYPNVKIDGIEYFDINTLKPLPKGYEIFISGGGIKAEPALHLPETVNTHPIYADLDEDGDGFVDGTKIPYDNVVEPRGITDTSSFKNLNPIAPPSVIEIRNTKLPYSYVIYDTANYKNVPDGGFFGKTRFVSDNNTYLGTDYVGKETETFKFITIE
jgi:hypothetical protein